ncbi:hypothetical protein GLOIN_2v1879650 [Rhizophagus irregularis DAOM 181602=DAOM 197198]|nr:hypothetical protein GLOIN_2v1879650 [Rhizophagus irregularis DAOM 181602=DAOM 197198]
MSKLNGEVLYLILKELNKIEKPLYTYLLINKSWCEIIISTLWKNPWKYTNFYHEEKLLLEFLGLELASDFYNEKWHCLENLSTHFLQILRARRVSIKPLARLIENTSGYLTEFTINNEGDNTLNNRIIIQAICKNLKYLKLSLRSANILELEKLLINCQYLEGLYILKIDAIDWGNLFEILAKSSPSSLFKFKFCFSCTKVEIESLKLFFDNWKIDIQCYYILYRFFNLV